MAPSSPRSGPDSQNAVLALPRDALYEILLRLPAKDLCGLRAVCRPWRGLLADLHFIAAHAARHPGPPLIVAGYNTIHRDDGVVCEIMDLSGDVVKRVRVAGEEWATSTQLGFVCTSKDTSSSILLRNLSTGAVFALPEGLAEEHKGRDIRDYISVAAFGQVASTGEYKVLRVLDSSSFEDPEQLCEIFTLDGSGHGRWRGKKAPPNAVSLDCWRSIVVNGIMYFLSSDFLVGEDASPDAIASFDLEREEWRASLRGPLSSFAGDHGHHNQYLGTNELSMAAMNGHLVVVHRFISSRMDLWFLVDLERGLWVKQHSIKAQLRHREYISTVRPLLVLDDGRIVLIYIGTRSGWVSIYNPSTNTSTDVAEMGHCFALGVYTGSPLSLASSAG